MSQERSLRDVLAEFKATDPEGFAALLPHMEFPNGALLEPVVQQPDTEGHARADEEAHRGE